MTLHPVRALRTIVGIGLAVLVADRGVQAAADAIPFRTTAEHRFILVEVGIDECDDVPFLLDTASSVTVVSEELFETLGLSVTSSRATNTHTGREMLPVSRIGELRLGPTLVFRDLEVLISDLSDITRLGAPVSGILGQDVFLRFNYLIDYRSSLIHVNPNVPLEGSLRGEWISFRLDNRRPILEVNVPNSQTTLMLALDSAASSLLLFEQPEHDVILEGHVVHVRLQSMLGHLLARRGTVRVLVVGGQQLFNVRTTMTPFPPGWTHLEQDGLLPTQLFEAVYVDNAARLMMFNPRWDSDLRVTAQNGTR